MARRGKVAVAAVMAASVMVSGCSSESPSATLNLPPSTCFGAFTPAELSPFMGAGKEVRVFSPVDLRLTADRTRETCNIEVDGKNRFTARAYRQPVGSGHSWPPLLDERKPEPLPHVENGKLWDDGAAVFLACEGSKESFELQLWLSGVADEVKQEERRPKFAALMAKYLDFAKQQTGCGA